MRFAGKSEDKVTAAPVQEDAVTQGSGKGRLSKTNSGPSSGDKDKKAVAGANNNNNKSTNKRTERPKSPVGGGAAK